MHKLTLSFVAALSLVTGGCKKTKDAPAGSGSAAAKTAEAKGSGHCPDGFTQKSTFCIKLPAGVVGDGGQGMAVGDGKTMQYGFPGGDKGSDYGITIRVSARNDQYFADNLEAVKKPTYQGKAIADGKIGDSGAWGSGEEGPPPAGYAQRHYLNAFIRGDKEELHCDVSRANGTGAPSEDDVFNACKTIAFAK